MTKYSRKFTNNRVVKAAICKPLNIEPLGALKKTHRNRRGNFSVPVSPLGVDSTQSRKFVKSNRNDRNNHDSIYTIGETDSGAFALGMV